MIVDVHAHFHRYFPGHEAGRPLPGRDVTDGIVEELDKAGVDVVCLISPPHDGVAEMVRRYPGRFVGLGYVRLDGEGPEQVTRLKDMGFGGLKMIRVEKNYDDESYFPVYERAEELGMPILFHTGQLAGGTSSARMRFIYLDTIARRFPGLIIIGAHLGVPSFAEAAWVARMNSNVYFDVSGPILMPLKNPKFGRVAHDMIFEAIAASDTVSQLVFGSDSGPTRIPPGDRPGREERFSVADAIEQYGRLLDRLEADEATRRAVFGETAARIFGLET